MEYCQGVLGDALSQIKWPTLAALLGGWLRLSVEKKGLEKELVYLMYAERMVDPNDIDEGWLEQNFKDGRVVRAAQKLLAGKEQRILHERWN